MLPAGFSLDSEGSRCGLPGVGERREGAGKELRCVGGTTRRRSLSEAVATSEGPKMPKEGGGPGLSGHS